MNTRGKAGSKGFSTPPNRTRLKFAQISECVSNSCHTHKGFIFSKQLRFQTIFSSANFLEKNKKFGNDKKCCESFENYLKCA
jgi:hypothetical protein